MSRSIWCLEMMIHWRTSIVNAWSIKTVPNQIRCIKSGNRSCTYPVGFKWQLTPSSLYVENVHGHWKKIWNLQQRTPWYHSSSKRMETLYPRIRTHHHHIFWSQKPDILQNSTETKQQASQMVPLSLWIWHQIDTLTRVKNDSIWCTVMTIWSWNRRTNGRRETILLPENMFINLLDTDLQERILNRKELDIDVKNAMEMILQEGPMNLKNNLEDWKIKEVDGRKTIFYKGKNYIPKDQELRWDVVKMYHDHKMAGHSRELETYNLIQQHYWWPGLRTFVKNYVQGCGMCQQFKINQSPSNPAYQAIEGAKTTRPFAHCSMDLITNLPPVEGDDSILVVVDWGLLKGVILCPCAKTLTWEGAAILLWDNLFKRFGLPNEMISDRDPRFAAHTF